RPAKDPAESFAERVLQDLGTRKDSAQRFKPPPIRFKNLREALEIHGVGIDVERILLAQPRRLSIKIGQVRDESDPEQMCAQAEPGIRRLHPRRHQPCAAAQRIPSVLAQIAGAGCEPARLMRGVVEEGCPDWSCTLCGSSLASSRIGGEQILSSTDAFVWAE